MGEIVQRIKSVDINNVEYLRTSSNQTVQNCYEILKQIGIRDISDLHKAGRFNIPLQGNALQTSKEVGRLQIYACQKREEAAKEKKRATTQSMGKDHPKNEEKDSSVRGARGYSTPVNSPMEIANDTMDMIELGDSYTEGGSDTENEVNAHPWNNKVINQANSSQGTREYVETSTTQENEKRKRNELSPGDDLPLAKTGTDGVVVLHRKNAELHSKNE